MTYDVDKAFLRYIVPFKYGESFEEAKDKISKPQIDEYKYKWKESHPDKSESDLFDYIKNEFKFDYEDKKNGFQKVGYEWTLCDVDVPKDGRKSRKEKILYFTTDKPEIDNDKKLTGGIDISISKVGLILFKNNVGFIWYEINLKKNLDSDMLMQFQNNIRELNRADVTHVWEKQSSCNNIVNGLVYNKIDNGIKKYIIPFSFGNWIDEILGMLKVKYFAERQNAYNSMVKNSIKVMQKNGFTCELTEESYISDERQVPDKAILFTYATLRDKCEDSQTDKYSMIYHITNGYKNTYHMSEQTVTDIKSPFQNAFWYATHEGGSYIVWPQEDNCKIFNDTILNKVKTDYFTLYIKVLYQSFSLIIYAERIQYEIPDSWYQEIGDNQESDKFTKIFADINFFLTKSMATSVSHIHHQSEFYIYIKKQLHIQENVDSVVAGLKTLDVLQREQYQRIEQEREKQEKGERLKQEEREKHRDEKTQAIMGLFALLGICSALSDGFAFVKEFNDGNPFTKLKPIAQDVSICVVAIIIVISVLAIIFTVKAVYNAFGKEKIDKIKKIWGKWHHKLKSIHKEGV